ncbi:hypothetical protein P2R44_22295 [Escherichia coli]
MGIFNRLKNVFVNGDYVGRDKIVYNTEPTQLMLLQEEYQEEFKNRQICTEMIDELNHYNTKKVKCVIWKLNLMLLGTLPFLTKLAS